MAGQYPQLKMMFLKQPADSRELYFIAGAAALKENDWVTSKRYMEMFMKAETNDSKTDAGKIFLAISYQQLGIYPASKELLQATSYSSDPLILETTVQVKKILDTWTKTKYRNPNIALGLSIIPGIGILYAGKPLEGTATFIAGAASVYTGYQWIEKKDYLDAGLWSLAFLYFYIRNFQTAYETAISLNGRRDSLIPGFIKDSLQIKTLIERHASASSVDCRLSLKY